MPDLGWKLIHRDGALWYEYVGERLGPFSSSAEAKVALDAWQVEGLEDDEWYEDEDGPTEQEFEIARQIAEKLKGAGWVVEGVGGDEIVLGETGVVQGHVDGGVSEDGLESLNATAIP